MEIGIFPQVSKGDGYEVKFHPVYVPIPARELNLAPIPIGDENFLPIQGKVLVGTGIPHLADIPTWQQVALKKIKKGLSVSSNDI